MKRCKNTLTKKSVQNVPISLFVLTFCVEELLKITYKQKSNYLEGIMIKTASTREIIEYLEAYEKIHGVGSVASIGSVCSGQRDVEYIFSIKDKDGNEDRVEIPTIDENTLWGDGSVDT